MPFCKYCGAELKEGTKFCPSCGKPVQEQAAPDTPQQQATQQIPRQNQQQPPIPQIPKKKKGKKGCLIAIAIIAAIIIISVVCSTYSKKREGKLVKIKEITGAKCLGCGKVFSAETTEVEKKLRYIKDKEFIYRYRDTLCAECEKRFAAEAKALFAEGKQLYNSGKYNEAKVKFAEAKKKGHNQADVWLEKIEKRKIEIEKQAKAKAESDARKAYAGLARNAFLDRGFDIKVRVHGPKNTYITLTYVLMGDVWVHNFEKSPMFSEIRRMGFKRVYYKDGYDYSKYTYWK